MGDNDNPYSGINDTVVSQPTEADLQIYDGSAWDSVAMSGDATITSAGVITVANDSHTHISTNISDMLDEDDMASDSATKVATQQSIKAYVDTVAAGQNQLSELTDTDISSPASNEVLVYDGSNSWDNSHTIVDEDDMSSDSTTNICTQQSIKKYVDASTSNPNLIYNPDGAIAQRGTSFTAASTPANNDDTYLFDRWLLLSDGNDVVDVSQDTDSPGGSMYSIKSIVATANKKWGFLQPLENKNSMPLDNEVVSVSFQVKTTAAKLINNVRVGVLSWDSTADSITSDVVSAWNASGVDPTLATNWTYENTPANIAVTTSWARDVSTVNVSIDTANMANVALFIWVDDDDASVGDELFLSQIKMEKSPINTKYIARHFQTELELCQRYFQLAFEDSPTYFRSYMAAGVERITFVRPVKMRASPTGTVVGTWTFIGVANSISLDASQESHFTVAVGTTGAGTGEAYNASDSAYMKFDAEL